MFIAYVEKIYIFVYIYWQKVIKLQKNMAYYKRMHKLYNFQFLFVLYHTN